MTPALLLLPQPRVIAADARHSAHAIRADADAAAASRSAANAASAAAAAAKLLAQLTNFIMLVGCLKLVWQCRQCSPGEAGL